MPPAAAPLDDGIVICVVNCLDGRFVWLALAGAVPFFAAQRRCRVLPRAVFRLPDEHLITPHPAMKKGYLAAFMTVAPDYSSLQNQRASRAIGRR